MDRNQRIARIIGMRKTPPPPRTITPHQTQTTYFVQSRPHPGAAWQRATGVTASWESKPMALERLAARREMQPNWEHRLMERVIKVIEQPATEEQ